MLSQGDAVEWYMMRSNVDEQRKWFNSQPRKPVSAAIVLTDDHGKILLLEVNYRKNWNLPGGVLEEHESPLDGVVRETQEELGIVVDRHSLSLCAVDYRPAKNGFIDKLYFYFYGGALTQQQIDAIKLQDEEIEQMRFVDLDEAKQLLSRWTYRQVVASLRGQGDKGLYLENGAVPGERVT